MRALLRRARGAGQAPPLELSPGCAFGALIEERLRGMEREVREARGRVNGLIFLIIAMIIAEIIMRLLG